MAIAERDVNVTVYESNVPAGIDGLDPKILATKALQDEKLSNRWGAIVDQLSDWLIDWGQQPGVSDEDGLIFPSGKACASGSRLVNYMRERDWPLPTGVIADGEGGIIFENKHDSVYQTVEIDQNGQMNLFTYRDCKLLSHGPLNWLPE